MYERVKKIAKKIVPKKILIRHEEFFRKIIAFKYRGATYYCNICEFNMSDFIVLANGNQLCPKCGSLPRNRRLFSVINTDFNLNNKTVLHFSPSRVMSTRLRSLESKEYVTTDFEGEFMADENIDITQINKKDDSFDLIICYHVLEHIEEDCRAISELFRVLKNGGECLIQTPFKSGEMYEDYSIKSPEERLHHFGQADHVRIYSIEGLINKLNKIGFEVNRRDFQTDPFNRMGFEQSETILIAKKP